MMSFIGQASYPKMTSLGASVIKLFTTVIYCHSMAIPSFFVIKLYYRGMAVNYHGKKFYNIGP
jgi:hypothetical protein